MTFLADECVDRQIVELLRLDGHEVAYVAEMSPGIMDDVVLMESRIFRQRRASTGVLLIRLLGLGSDVKAAIVRRAIREHGRELAGAFAVLSPASIRIRREILP